MLGAPARAALADAAGSLARANRLLDIRAPANIGGATKRARIELLLRISIEFERMGCPY
jgi:hypothetical protein